MPMILYTSDVRGDVVCLAHAPPRLSDTFWANQYRPMGPREQALFRVDVADVIAPDEPLCEVCRGRARRENGATARGARR